MRGLYNTGIAAYGLAIRVASLLNPKAKKWLSGRKNWQETLKAGMQGKRNWIWIHCASLGEFEQGRPLLERIKKENPEFSILLTFFSPSGYEVRKNYALADHVAYLPLDTPENARQFIKITRPVLTIFVKYEVWVNFISECKNRQIPVVMISGLFRKNSRFFKGFLRALFQETLRGFAHIFTQDQGSVSRLKSAGISAVSFAGDTRYDRTMEIAAGFEPIPGIEKFLKPDDFCIVCGSTWDKDISLLLDIYQDLRDLPVKWIVAPHDINKIKIMSVVSQHPYEMITWSAIRKSDFEYKMLWIDNIGMLSRLYHYGDIAYIGGGFGLGIHNILEATAFGIPVVFGPNYTKFQEANEMVEAEVAFPVRSARELKSTLLELFHDPAKREKLKTTLLEFMHAHSGATHQILRTLREKELLPPPRQ